MSSATDIREARCKRRSAEIAAALRAEWRMIASVSLRPCRDGLGFEAQLCLDPILVRGAFEQQGFPRTPAALARLEARRSAALEECVQRVNEALPDAGRIRSFSVVPTVSETVLDAARAVDG